MAKKADATRNARKLRDQNVEWFLTSSSAMLGERSSFGALISAIEAGKSFSKYGAREPPREPVTDRMLGLGEGYGGVGLIEWERRCRAAWIRLPNQMKMALVAFFCPIYGKLPPGYHGQLGEYACVALQIAEDKMQRHVLDDAVKRRKVTRWRNLSHRAVRDALEFWDRVYALALREVA